MATEKQEDEMVQTAIKVRRSWLSRIDKIAERMSTPSLEINRTDAIRAAIHQWMEKMETEPAVTPLKKR